MDFRRPETAASDETYTMVNTTKGHLLRALGGKHLSLFTFHFSPFTSRLQLLLLLICFLVLSSSAHAAGGATGLAYPVDPATYHDDDVTFMPAKLWVRAQP